MAPAPHLPQVSVPRLVYSLVSLLVLQISLKILAALTARLTKVPEKENGKHVRRRGSSAGAHRLLTSLVKFKKKT